MTLSQILAQRSHPIELYSSVLRLITDFHPSNTYRMQDLSILWSHFMKAHHAYVNQLPNPEQMKLS